MAAVQVRLTGGGARALALIALTLLAPARAAEPATGGGGAHSPHPRERWSWQLFGDLDYRSRGSGEGAVLSGELGLQVTAGLSDRLSFFSEWTANLVEAEDPAADAGFEVEIERIILKYERSDALRLSAGRFHTPVSHWNTVFHHGVWLQTSIDRPLIIRFENELSPAHFEGLMVEGELPLGGIGLGYTGGTGKGRGTELELGEGDSSIDGGTARVAGLSARPRAVPDLIAGLAVYSDRVRPAAGGVEFDETIETIYLAWHRASPELLSEHSRIRHRAVQGGPRFEHRASYLQLAYRLRGFSEPFKPYFRYERLEIDERDPLFAGTLSERLLTFGLRVDLTPALALKVEARRSSRPPEPRRDLALLQLAWVLD